MLEYSANATTRDAITRAHAERGKAARQIWRWLFQSRKRNRAVGLLIRSNPH